MEIGVVLRECLKREDTWLFAYWECSIGEYPIGLDFVAM